MSAPANLPLTGPQSAEQLRERIARLERIVGLIVNAASLAAAKAAIQAQDATDAASGYQPRRIAASAGQDI